MRSWSRWFYERVQCRKEGEREGVRVMTKISRGGSSARRSLKRFTAGRPGWRHGLAVLDFRR